MSFFSKRSTAFVVMVVVILSCLGYGQSKRPVDTPPPGVSGSHYLLDDAAVLSADTQKYIAQMNNDLFSKTGAQILVATVKTTGDATLADYAIDLGMKKELSSNSLVLLLATQDGGAVAIQGEGILQNLTDDNITRLMTRYLQSDFEKGNYDKGTRKVFDQFIGWYEDYYHVKITPSSTVAGAVLPQNNFDGGLTLLIVILLLVLVIFSISMTAGRRRGRTAPRRRSFVPPFTTYPGYPPMGGAPRPPRVPRPPVPPFVGGFGPGSAPRNDRRNSPPPPSGGFGSTPRSGGGFGSTPRSGGGFGSTPRSGGGFGSTPRSGGGFGSTPRSGGGFGSSPRSGGGFGGSSSRGGGFGKK